MRGKDFALYVNTTDDAEFPTFEKVAGQRGGTLNRSSEGIDITTKDNSGWTDEDYGSNSWGVDLDGVIPENQAAYERLEEAWLNQEFVLVQWRTPTRKAYQGLARIEDFPEEAPYDDTATYSLTLVGKGKPEIIPEVTA